MTPEQAMAAAIDEALSAADDEWTVAELADLILAALDGWTLVPSEGVTVVATDLWNSTVEMAAELPERRDDESEIDRLRAALIQARDRMETAWHLMHPGDLTADEREGMAQAMWFGMEELARAALAASSAPQEASDD